MKQITAMPSIRTGAALFVAAVSAFAAYTTADETIDRSCAEPSINTQPLPPHDPRPDGINPKPLR